MAIAYDNLGREINTANMTLKDIKDLIGSCKVGPAKAVAGGSSDNSDHLAKIHHLLEKHTADYNAEIQEQKGFLQSVVDNLKDFTSKKEEKKKTSREKSASKEAKSTAKSSDRLAKEFHRTLGTKGSGWVHDPYCEKVLSQIYSLLSHNASDRAMNRALQTGQLVDARNAGFGHAGHGTPTPPNPPTPPTPPDPDNTPHDFYPTRQEVERMAFTHLVLHRIQKLSNDLQTNFLGFNGFNTIFKDIVDEERKFTQGVRAAAYEVAGITKESQKLQQVYEQIGKSTHETGFNRSETQKYYLKALKAGIKSEKISLNLVKSQLNTEMQLGLEAGTLNDTFMTMNQAGRMNNMQIAEMGRGMRNVARNTGMTGEALNGAIKSSEEFTNNLRKAAQLTAASVENIIEIQAHAKRLGIAGEMQPLLQAMTSSNNLLTKASKETQAFLFQAAGMMGRTQDLMNGTITRSKSGLKDMAKGMEQVLTRFGIESLDAIDNLSDEAKTTLNLQLNAAYGLELGDVRSAIEAMQEAGKGMADRLAEINKQRKLNLTTEEKATLAEKERSLKAGSNLKVLTALSEATKGTGDGVEGMTKALAKFENRKGEFEEDMKAMGQTWTSSGDAAKQAIQGALNEINMGRKKAGMQALTIDSKDIEAAMKDKSAYELIVGRLNKGEQELATAQKKQLDPMTNMDQNLQEINDNIRIFTQSMFSKLFNSVLGKMVAILGVLASIAAGFGFMGLNFLNFFHDFRRLSGQLRHILGIRGAAGAAHAGATGAANAGNVVNATRGSKTFLEAMQQRFRIAGKRITRTTDMWAKNLTTGTERIAEQVSKAPLKTFKDLVVSSWKNTFTATKDGLELVGKKIGTGYTKVAELTGRGAARIWELAKELPKLARGVWDLSKAAIKGVPGAMRALPGLLTNGIGKGFAAIVKVSGQAGGGLLKLAGTMNPLGLAVMAAFVAIDGLTGAFDAGARAGEIFGKAQEDVTLNQEYAAKSAGFLVGILNGLTFGLLGLILPLDKITNGLARFNAKIPILTIILTPFIVVLEILWGVIKGITSAIWEVIKGIGSMIMNIVNPIVEGVSSIFEALGNIFGGVEGKASGLVKLFREMGGVVGIVSGAIKFVGTAIGWVFSAIGSVIGFIIKTVFKFIEGFLVVLEPMAEVFGALQEGVSEVFNGLWEISSIPFDIFSELYNGLKPVIEMFTGGDGTTFFEGVKYVAKVLGQAVGMLLKFVLQPLMLVAKFIKFVGKIIKSVGKMLRLDFKGAGIMFKDAFVGAFTGIIETLIWPFKKIAEMFYGIGKWLWDNTLGRLIKLGNWLWDAITGALGNLGSFLLGALQTAFVDIPLQILKAVIGGFVMVFNELTNIISNFVTTIKEKISDALRPSGSAIRDQKKMANAQNSDLIKANEKIVKGAPIEEQQRQLRQLKDQKSGAEKNIKYNESQVKSWNPFRWDYISDANSMAQAAANSEKKRLESINKGIEALEKSIQEQTDPIKGTRKALAKGEKKGSLYVHDIHTEGILDDVSSSTDKMSKDLVSNKRSIQLIGGRPLDTALSDSLGTASTMSSANPVASPVASVDLAREVAQKTAETQPAMSEVIAPELGELTAESTEQTALLMQMVALMQKFVEATQPKSHITRSNGGHSDSNSQTAHHPQANYWRAPIGHVEQTPAKAIMNVGMNNI